MSILLAFGKKKDFFFANLTTAVYALKEDLEGRLKKLAEGQII